MKIFTYAVFMMICISMFVAGYFISKGIYKQQHSFALPTQVPSQLNTVPVSVYKDTAGIEHYVYKSSANTITKTEALKQASPLLPYIDSLALALNIKARQLEVNSVINTRTEADSTPFFRKQIDSLKRLVFFYNDKYLKLTVRAGNPTDTLDKGNFDFSYDASLNINQYFKRKKILGMPIGSKESFADISSNDPRTTISGVKKFTVKQQMPGYGVRLQGLAGYNFDSHAYIIGPGIRYDFDKWSLLGAYYYNAKLQRWQPSVNLRYDILRF